MCYKGHRQYFFFNGFRPCSKGDQITTEVQPGLLAIDGGIKSALFGLFTKPVRPADWLSMARLPVADLLSATLRASFTGSAGLARCTFAPHQSPSVTG
jgi:hypothetical protein